MEQNNVILVDSILMNLDCVYAIFLLITFLNGLTRKFTRLTAKHDTCTQTSGNGRRHDEATTLDTHNLGHTLTFVEVNHFVSNFLKSFR